MATIRERTKRADKDAPLKGTVKTIKRTEGYGFITHNATGTDYFFHRSQVGEEFEHLEVDQPVEFIPVEGPKGPRAESVFVL